MIYNYALYILFFSIFIIITLELREIFLYDVEKIVIFILLTLIVISSVTFTEDIYVFYKNICLFPFLMIISIIDIKEKYVFDVDIFGGIIVNMGVFTIYSLNSLYFDFEIKEIFLNKIIISMCLSSIALILYRFGGLGMGDVLLFFLVGLCSDGSCFRLFDFEEIIKIRGFNLGYCLASTFLIFLISFVSAALCCIKKLIKRDYGDGIVPFTPFISIGFILANQIL